MGDAVFDGYQAIVLESQLCGVLQTDVTADSIDSAEFVSLEFAGMGNSPN